MLPGPFPKGAFCVSLPQAGFPMLTARDETRACWTLLKGKRFPLFGHDRRSRPTGMAMCGHGTPISEIFRSTQLAGVSRLAIPPPNGRGRHGPHLDFGFLRRQYIQDGGTFAILAPSPDETEHERVQSDRQYAPATIRLCAAGVARCKSIPRPMRMNENSPICASAADTNRAVLRGRPRANTIPSAASDFPTTVIATTAST